MIKTQHQKEREVSRGILFPDVGCIDLLRYNYFFDEGVRNYVRSDFDSAGNVILPLEKREVQEVDCEEDRHQAMCGVCGKIRLVECHEDKKELLIGGTREFEFRCSMLNLVGGVGMATCAAADDLTLAQHTSELFFRKWLPPKGTLREEGINHQEVGGAETKDITLKYLNENAKEYLREDF